uniref:PD(D/E)XK endonuclease domain-containing protein n=1 Tax=viral metagenome TaxID=1070528 RepID=A0A6C0ECL7_9ZZZZ
MSKKGYSSNYSRGIRAENSVASTYKSNGWSVKQSPGSRGAADLTCTKGATTHYVQVKSSGVSKPYISSSEVGRLKSTATRNNATSVIATVQNGSQTISYAKTGGSVKL